MKYFLPESAEEAVRIKNENPGSRYLAGGTELFSSQVLPPFKGTVISLEKLGLAEISGGRIGSGATLEELRTNLSAPLFMRAAAGDIASRNIRNIATVGGNIGSNKSSSDLLPALIASGALLTIYTETGEKEISGDAWTRDPRGLILQVRFPNPGITVFQRRFSRTKNDLSLLKLAAGYILKDGIISSVCIAAGCVSKQVIKLEKTAALLEGAAAGGLDPDSVSGAAREEVSPISDHRASGEYRRRMLSAAVEEFLKELSGKENGN